MIAVPKRKNAARSERARRARDERTVLAQLDQWASGAKTDQSTLNMHARVARFLFEHLRRPTGVIDPMIVPYG